MDVKAGGHAAEILSAGAQWGRSTCSGGLLFGQCLLESLLSVSDEILIACRVDKHTGAILPIVLQFREHIEVPAVCAKKYVTGQSTQDHKCMLEVLNNAG